jgi:hypothetical protein
MSGEGKQEKKPGAQHEKGHLAHIEGGPPGNAELDPKQQTRRRDLPPEKATGEGEPMRGSSRPRSDDPAREEARPGHEADEPGDRKDRPQTGRAD